MVYRFILAGLLVGVGTAQAHSMEDSNMVWDFFLETDRAAIKANATTARGAQMIQKLRDTVEKQQQHGLIVPATEGGHFHHYFCPEHKRLLDFDWESPHAHWCSECGKHWTGELFDRGWINRLHSHNGQFLLFSTILHLAEVPGDWLAPVKELLLEYSRMYLSWQLHGHDMVTETYYAGRMYCQTLDESMWIVNAAPAYRELLPQIDDSEQALIRTGLLKPMFETIMRYRAHGNWQVWHNAGVASLAIALEDENMLDIALNDPEHGYHYMLDTGVTAEGWWDERSPGYHFFPLDAMFRTAEAVRCRGINLYDDRLKHMLVGPLKSAYADLSFPAHNDGWHGDSVVRQAHLYELAAYRYQDQQLAEIVAACYARGYEGQWQVLMIPVTIEPDDSPILMPSTLLPDTGVACLRYQGITAVLKYGPHGGTHGHPDKLSITLHDGNTEVLLDLGTPGYGVPDHGGWYRKTISHSTIVVDHHDQQETTGQLIDFIATDMGGTVIAESAGAYPGVHATRSLHLSGNVLEDVFECVADSTRTYDYVLISAFPVVSPPTDAVPAQLPEVLGYDRIVEARMWTGNGVSEFNIGAHKLRIECESPCVFMTGQAPGVPGRSTDGTTLQLCYPLLIRVQNPEMKIKATWTLTTPYEKPVTVSQ